MTPLQRLLTKSHKLNKARTRTFWKTRYLEIIGLEFDTVQNCNIEFSIVTAYARKDAKFIAHVANVHGTLLEIIRVQQKALQFYADGDHWWVNDNGENICDELGKKSSQALSIVDELASKMGV